MVSLCTVYGVQCTRLSLNNIGRDSYSTVKYADNTPVSLADTGQFTFNDNIDANQMATLTSNIIHAAIFQLDPLEVKTEFQKRSMFDAFAKIGGASVVAIVCLMLYGKWVTKPIFRQARAFIPNDDSFKRLLRKKQEELKSFKYKLHDMKRPLVEMGIQFKEDAILNKQRQNAIKDLDEYLQDKETNEMMVFYNSLKKALLVNLDDFDDPLEKIDLNTYYASGGQAYRKTGLVRAHSAPKNDSSVATALNMLSLNDIERQLNVLSNFLRKTGKDLEYELTMVVNDREHGRQRD